jgi:O-antigen/teichoic acid export membrane protein
MNLVLTEVSRFRSSKMVRNASWLVAGQGLGLVLQAVYFILLARLLGPIEYGVYAGAFAFASLVAPYGPLGTGTIFLRYVSSDRLAFSVYWGNILAVTTVVGGGMVLALVAVGSHVLNSASAALVLLAAISQCVFAQVIVEASRVFQTFEHMRPTALLNLLTSAVRTIASGVMLIMLHHATAWQWAVVSTGVSGLAAIATVATITIHFGRPRFSMRIFLKHNLEGVGYAAAMSTASIYNDLDKTMLSHYGMNHANGIYAMAYRIIDIATIPIFSIRDAAMPRLFKLGHSGLAASAELAHLLLRRGAALAALASVAMFALAGVIPLVVGHAFAESVLALRWLCLIPLFRSVHQMTGSALTGAGMQNWRTGSQVSAALLNFGLNLWLIPRYGWHGAAWSSVATDGALAALCWGMVQFNLRRRETLA